jgi:flagellin
MSRSLERLSSGFRINRAADDPAGLIISENLRAQISGLGQAINNSNNAVNVVKTAEAALDEVLKQLRSIRTLALDALNTGSSDAVARAADQTQIKSSIETINRVGNTTQFGKIKLLNGSSGVRGSSNSNDLDFISGATGTVAGTYDVNVAQVATKGSKTFTIKNEYETGASPTTFEFQASDKLLFQIDFGVEAGLSATEVNELGTQLTASGLTTDSSQTGVNITFNEEDATAYVVVDRSAAGTTDNKIDSTLLANLNGSTIGQVVNFTAEDSAGTGFVVTGRFAGLDYAVNDMQADATNDIGQAGFTADGTQSIAAAVATTITAAGSAVLTFDFGAGLDTTGKAALGAALTAAGLASESGISLNADDGGNASVGKLVFTEATATLVATVTAGTETTAAETSTAMTALLMTRNSVNVDQLVQTVAAASKLSFTFGGNVAATVTGDAITGVTSVITSSVTAGLGAAEVGQLGAGAGLGVSDIKTLGETLTINDSTIVDIAAGTALTSVVSRINAALKADEIDATVSFKADTTGSDLNELSFNNIDFGSKLTTVKSTKSSSLDYHLGIGTSIQNVQGKDVSGTINGVKADGSGQFLTLTSAGDNADGIRVKFTGTTAPTDGTLKATVTQDSLLFQVGANSGQTVKQAIDDVRSNKLGRLATGLLTSAKSVADIDVNTSDGANDALKLVDDAINSITTLRGNLGAFQANVLESNINSLGVAKENLASAESAIRDADFAEETVQFTRNQILLQAGTAILTQANAIPQAVLQLLQ